MNRYKEMCDTYRYRIFCVDFTDIPIEEVKRRFNQTADCKKRHQGQEFSEPSHSVGVYYRYGFSVY